MSAFTAYTKAVISVVGTENVSTKLPDRIVYSQSCTNDAAGTPALVARPHSAEEIASILRLANLYEQPVWVWGRGTLFVGSGVRDGFTVLDLTAMNRLVKLDLENLSVTAEAGMTWGAVNGVLRKQGWELSVQGSGGLLSATVGGTIAANAVPHGLTKGGMTGEGVLNLQVVLPSGEIIRTGSAANPKGRPFFRYGSGADLSGLFIGSCGAFGIITEATLKIQRVPDAEAFHCYGFGSYQEAFKAAVLMQQRECARFIVAVQGDLPEEVDAQTMLHIIVDGRPEVVEAESSLVRQACSTNGGRELDNTGTRNYWTSHDVMYSWLRWKDKVRYYRWRSGTRPYFCPEVTAVIPYPELNDLTGAFWRYWESVASEREKYAAFLKGFDIYFARGGGSIWIDTLFPSDEPAAVEFGLRVQRELFEIVLGFGGAPPLLGAGVQAGYTMPRLGGYYNLLKTIKTTLDPKHILNPGVLAL